MTESSTRAAVDPFDDPETSNKMAVRALVFLLITFILGTLCLQGFNLVFQQVGKDVGAVQQASLITALPSIVLGIVCFIYGSLGDFVSLKKLVVTGLVVLFIGSIFGFVANFFFTANLWTVIIARILQTAGEQVAGSVYLVVTTKYLKPSLKVVAFGVFTAGYQVSAAIGVFAAGLLSSISWQYLFLIPAITIFFLPALLKSLPNKSGSGDKVDWLGFTIFGLATAFLTLFFSYTKVWLLIVAAALYVVFGVYITKAKDPFVTPEFFKNTRWIMAICLILFFYFNNYCMSPIFNAICRDVFGITNSATVSMHIVWAFLVAAFFGTTSGAIVDKIGRQPTLIIAACLMIVGWAGSAFVISSGLIPLTLMACVFYAGAGLMYSPVVSTVLDTLPKEQSGRGVGMNDLVMNVTGSIGIAIFGGLMAGTGLGGGSIAGGAGQQAVYANLLLIAAVIAALGLVIYLVFRKKIYAED
ncbi:major facilitator superfamily MFS_1 [Bifidobacterium actinocoloniiforme DSM 22766]|uniref:Major facilitator superfamily MFS_1 n=1 Tax=Bifidobacterium actinocoloniiforme DSM 22766 TaxID=1437605 RepID=A0A086YYC4_9BIFI|nr:MFS transporter [Bifidobacterium actinocoloniiforme]AKV55839.1 membrane protein [Bifidobacterium actinocoloniiforme DSM 22766]KFI39274.1 major facilitator superfamily MFS_1 [Bifidobacterium actinocoloniiforme DSM 22766]